MQTENKAQREISNNAVRHSRGGRKGIWEKTSVMSELKNDLGRFRITWHHPVSFGIIWIRLGLLWKHLGSCMVICDRLGSCVFIGSPGIAWDHPGSSVIISKLIRDLLEGPSERRHLKEGI